ncbi:uncharacterized protein LY89DRAFT_743872 [Mollisia scopiformis]|uniref:Nuclear pore protein n=1 Tax=Mollisia scopiformis TaxID=149040 RepID=A0A132B1Y4_MOLSC|nr:uncharacterized protein LY89DRAFT_743872 [Mollisia scopiformis]KUJ06395.1 hypothetical protein LY89DRAFT_743872 [Mollisia scopiformis]
MASPDYTELFTFPNGDVEIVVNFKGETIRGRVNSNNMTAASKVFSLFINPPWVIKEPEIETTTASTDGVRPDPALKCIECSDDDGYALLVLLRLIHIQLGGVPDTLPTDTLLKVAALVEKYDCRNLIHSWAALWCAEATTKAKDGDADTWLYIAWAFGRRELMEDMARKILLEATVSEAGQLMVYDKENVTQVRQIQELQPFGFEDNVRAIRLQTIQDLLDVAYAHVSRFGGLKQIPCDVKDKHSADCASNRYCEQVYKLRKLGLFPRVTADRANISIEKLAEEVKNMGKRDIPYNKGHEKCFKGTYERDVERIMSNLGDPVLDSHRTHTEPRHRKGPEDPLMSLTEKTEKENGKDFEDDADMYLIGLLQRTNPLTA